VKLQSDIEQPTGDPGRSLFTEVQLLKADMQQLCKAVRSLVQFQATANQKLDLVLRSASSDEPA